MSRMWKFFMLCTVVTGLAATGVIAGGLGEKGEPYDLDPCSGYEYTSSCMTDGSVPLAIYKRLYCDEGPGYSDNAPYYVGNFYKWWQVISVKAYEDLTDVVVTDRFGGELMILAICVDDPKDPDHPFNPQPFDYAFAYDPYARNGVVEVTGLANAVGTLNRRGISFDSFGVAWTGIAVKAHFRWEIGDMAAGDEKKIWVVVGSDTNPAGHQEYTSPGLYALNSGAVVKGFLADTGKQATMGSASIWIEVLP